MGRIGEALRTRRRLLIAVTAATLGIICGYDLSNIAGALLFITNDFNLTVRKQELLTTIVVIGEICGALSGGFLANAIGRKRSMMLVSRPHVMGLMKPSAGGGVNTELIFSSCDTNVGSFGIQLPITMRPPSLVNFFRLSEKPIASLVQPEVSSLG